MPLRTRLNAGPSNTITRHTCDEILISMYYICKFPSYILCDGGVYIRISDINNFPIGQSLSRHNLLHNLTLIMHHKSIGQNNLMISHCTFFNFTTVWITRFFKKKVFHSVYLSLSVFSPLFPWYWHSRPHQAFCYNFFFEMLHYFWMTKIKQFL